MQQSQIPALFDTNILIDYLNGITQAKDELASYANKNISIITYMEVLAGVPDHAQEPVKQFLATFEIININTEIADMAVAIRQSNKIKLPDAIILASSQYIKGLLITRNTKDFAENDKGVRVPYQV